MQIIFVYIVERSDVEDAISILWRDIFKVRQLIFVKRLHLENAILDKNKISILVSSFHFSADKNFYLWRDRFFTLWSPDSKVGISFQ